MSSKPWRPIAVVLALALAGAAVASCFPSKKSSDFRCDDDADCDADRTCDRGYCVVRPIDAAPQCPSACNNGCDLLAQTCSIRCSSPNQCNNVTCPSGYACDIACTGSNTCGGAICPSTARSCTITCGVSNACNNVTCSAENCTFACGASGACEGVTCGTGAACTVHCTATGACDGISCSTACSCDVNCAAGACDTMTCPIRGGTQCREGGVSGAPCDPTAAPECVTCT